MKTFAGTSFKPESTKKIVQTIAPAHSVIPAFGSRVYRKSACPCGGSCPACKSKTGDLKLSHPNDPVEVEADRMADRILRMASHEDNVPDSTSFRTDRSNQKVHRKLGPRASETFGGASHIRSAVGAGGQPLDEHTRDFFEPRLGLDLGGVRVHTGSAATRSARAIDARAYTLGRDIVFGHAEYDPATESGRKLLAHELAHVAQQADSPDTIRRKVVTEEDEIHGSILDDFSAETGVPRGQASQHSPEYEQWLADKQAGAEEFRTYKLKAEHLKIPQVSGRFERMSLEELYQYRQQYMFDDESAKDPAVIKYLSDLMMGRPLQTCSKAEIKRTDDLAKQVMKDVPAMVNNALTAITRLLSLWSSDKPDLIAKRSKFSGQVGCAFTSNFNITETDSSFGTTAIRVERRLIQLQKRIAKPVSFTCEGINSKICLESKGRDAEGYVVNHQDPIHLCFSFRDGSIYDFQRSTIIHELLHLLPGLDDAGGYANFSTSAMTCRAGIQFSATPDVLDNTADAITGFIMHIENTGATDIKVVPF